MSCILKACKKLRGCINQVEMRNPSGASEQDIMNEAKEMLKLDGSYKKGFKFDHVLGHLKDSESLSNVTASTQYQRQSPYQSPSSGPGSSSGTDAGLPSLTIHDAEEIRYDCFSGYIECSLNNFSSLYRCFMERIIDSMESD
ncbi:uncharacterized protein LOC112526403 [Cynara cardunculus var. scolymus]|uniref:uncharacterized protein LOC112526403 n=1 Tax=Cynara cardunculus var. scolymus TaxID=59895 RepID=UPI000D62E50B|nr:uncharacterized protein LOC112526403 [Cynara cardunculus var. scolymus]